MSRERLMRITCDRCGKIFEARYFPWDGTYQVALGWYYDKERMKDYCPECFEKLKAMVKDFENKK